MTGNKAVVLTCKCPPTGSDEWLKEGTFIVKSYLEGSDDLHS